MAETAPYRIDPPRVATIEPVLRRLVQAMIDFVPAQRHG
jgi:hypothetical protein